ncbi:histidine phosphatase family protein [Phascolarctobacterium faecium]|uniref:histidine phosphatase family protein n=1 Tax=Phascolarctobacterium faecium TaxID=33025 RepID=UPI00352215F0
MENIVLDEIYSSSMQRARQTAAPLAEAHGLTVPPLDELKEVCFGEWEGLSYDEIKAKWSDQLELFFKTAGTVQNARRGIIRRCCIAGSFCL